MPEKAVKIWNFLAAMAKRLLLLPIARLKYGKKEIWLICERGTDARDNGYHMFRYLRKEHPEIDAWYVITRDSADLKKIADLGNIAFRGSLNHWLVYISADKILTAFEQHFCPSPSYSFYRYVWKAKRQRIVFLQHGVIANDIPIYHQEKSGFNIFICGAKPEYDFVSSHYHYKHGEVRYTGLARFDALHNISVKQQVLIMPTYRKWLKEKPAQEVAQSKYVQHWQSFLNSPRLKEMADKYQIPIVFYPHQLMQKNIGLFSSDSPWIQIADCMHYDVQPLLIESALLITDYSSVHFDFGYMKKPVLYYQFDEQEVFEKHTERGYFDFHTMGFGECVETETALLDRLEEYLAAGLHEKPQYEKRLENFFQLHDTHNCKRIFQEIVKG